MQKTANLPTELEEDILLRLPVKPLVRFRCVSKRWLALINSPDFIKLHLNRSIETRNNRSIIVTPKHSPGTYWVNVDSPDSAAVEEIDHPLKNSPWPEVMGSCSGLVLLRYGGSGFCDDIIIWNPSTRNHHELPSAVFNSMNIFVENVVYGLGYDSVHDDYKVVRIIQLHTKSTQVDVYSLKSNSWRRIRDFPYKTWDLWCHGVLSGGALHWVLYESYSSHSPCHICAFDLATEEYRLVPMPNNVDDNYGMILTVLEGCLCVTCKYWEKQRMDVWVMKSYGVRESWTKLISVGFQKYTTTFEFTIPLAFSKDGRQILLKQKDKLVWFELESKVEKMDYVRVPSYSQVDFITESLVPICSGSGSNNRFGGRKE